MTCFMRAPFAQMVHTIQRSSHAAVLALTYFQCYIKKRRLPGASSLPLVVKAAERPQRAAVHLLISQSVVPLPPRAAQASGRQLGSAASPRARGGVARARVAAAAVCRLEALIGANA